MLKNRIKRLEKNLVNIEIDHEKIEVTSRFFFKGDERDCGKKASGLLDKLGLTRAYVFDFDRPEESYRIKRN